MSDAGKKLQARGGEMDAPERIWVSEQPSITHMGVCHIHKLTKATEYIRADLAAPAPALVADGVLSNDEIAAIIKEGPGRIVQAPPAPAPDLAELVEALRELIAHTHDCEKELTEELHHADFCGESLPLTKARAALAKIKEPQT